MGLKLRKKQLNRSKIDINLVSKKLLKKKSNLLS